MLQVVKEGCWHLHVYCPQGITYVSLIHTVFKSLFSPEHLWKRSERLLFDLSRDLQSFMCCTGTYTTLACYSKCSLLFPFKSIPIHMKTRHFVFNNLWLFSLYICICCDYSMCLCKKKVELKDQEHRENSLSQCLVIVSFSTTIFVQL